MNYKKTAPEIFTQIIKSKSILMCLHAGPDGDSVGSCLAFYHYLKPLNKKITIITGDSHPPASFFTLPGAQVLQIKSFFDLDPKDYDLFIVLDTASPSQISKLKEVQFPTGLKTIVIDHHDTNLGFGDINLIDKTAPATCQILTRMFFEFNLPVTVDTAICLLIGLYTDTGGYKWPKTTGLTFNLAARLARIAPDYSQSIFNYENNDHPDRLKLVGFLLSHITTYFGGQVALAQISQSQVKKLGVSREAITSVDLGNMIKAVVGYEIGGTVIEGFDGKVKVSLRTRDAQKYDLGRILSATGYGGGHKAAAGASIPFKLKKSLNILLSAIAQNNPELGEP